MAKIKAYKVFNPDWTCRDFQYKLGKEYSIKGDVEMCYNGFHACKNLIDCFSYYNFNPENKVAEVELSGEILGIHEDKQCASKIKIVKELSWQDVLEMVNTGKGNSGLGNSGDWNSGDRNSGGRNSGDWNSGGRNSGDCNSGDRNSGDWNSGDWNSGDCNSGDWNSGDCNSGDRNSGDRNSGDWNSGDRNSGDRNSGDWNSGDRNSGDRNSGDCNSGDWNACNYSSGYFNSITQDEIIVFNKPCLRSVWDNAIKPPFIYNIELTYWENEELKTRAYKEAWKVAFENASEEDIKLLKALPNFDAKVFKEITGIDVG